jgi:hypothetical protein
MASLVSPHAKDKARVLAPVQKRCDRGRPISCRSARSQIYAVDRSVEAVAGQCKLPATVASRRREVRLENEDRGSFGERGRVAI